MSDSKLAYDDLALLEAIVFGVVQKNLKENGLFVNPGTVPISGPRPKQLSTVQQNTLKALPAAERAKVIGTTLHNVASKVEILLAIT